MAVPATVIYFTSYEQLKSILNHRPWDRNDLWKPMVAGMVARGKQNENLIISSSPFPSPPPPISLPTILILLVTTEIITQHYYQHHYQPHHYFFYHNYCFLFHFPSLGSNCDKSIGTCTNPTPVFEFQLFYDWRVYQNWSFSKRSCILMARFRAHIIQRCSFFRSV